MPSSLKSQMPSKLEGISGIAYAALQLSVLSSRLALENRTLVNHSDGRPENVAEHSLMLTIIAPVIAEIYYPYLDANLISRFASVHDAVEAYVGDTPTHDIDSHGLKKKVELETEGLEQLKNDFALMPNFIKVIDQYEAQTLAEARFVRVVDKWMPVLVHFSDKGATVRSYTDPKKLVDDYKVHADRLKREYPDFVELITVREELTQLVGTHLF